MMYGVDMEPIIEEIVYPRPYDDILVCPITPPSSPPLSVGKVEKALKDKYIITADNKNPIDYWDGSFAQNSKLSDCHMLIEYKNPDTYFPVPVKIKVHKK